MAAKPFIGINLDCPYDRFAQGCIAIPMLSRWLDCTYQSGGVPLLVPPVSDDDDLGRILEMFDGFVFVRQNDSDLRPTMRSGRESAEDWAIRLLRLVAGRRLPLLSLGRGMQLLNLALGGDLTKSRADDSTARYGHVPRRPLTTRPNSLMGQIYEARSVPVGSVYESNIGELAAGMQATAWTDDGVIAAFESESDDWFACGIHFLPEADALDDTDLRLFSILIDEAVATSDRSTSHRWTPRERSRNVRPFSEFAEPTA